MAAVGACNKDSPSPPRDAAGTPARPKAASSSTEPPWFKDIAEESGLHFQHTTGATGQFYFPEIAGSGCALFDYDGDGDLDVFAIQCYPLDPAIQPSEREKADWGKDRLFRNDLQTGADGRRVPRFVDVTDEAGVGDRGYGMGCAVGDYDNDGRPDLLVTNYGRNTLYHNKGDGTFEDVTATALTQTESWNTSAAFVDYDRDGFLDLYVASYVGFSVQENKMCHSRSSRRDYCGPQTFDPTLDHLFHNNGDGTFTDVSRQAGVNAADGSGLGVACADYDLDGWQDIYVANDGNANQLWVNQHNGTFINTALEAGAAYNGEGMPEAGMGVTAADFDLDGDEDIFVSHLVSEHNTLFVNNGHAVFEDRTNEHWLAAMSLPYTGFGVEWHDFDGDGYLDLFVANGAVKIAEEYADRPYPYVFPKQLIRNLGPPDFHFEDISAKGGPDVLRPESSRGTAFGDIDNDGDVDLLISNSNGPLRLLRNDAGNGKAWMVLKLIGVKSNRSAIGAIVRLERPRGPMLMRHVHSDGSYCSANDFRVYFGLAGDVGPFNAMVTWPNGLVERFADLPVGRETTLTEGQGVPAS